MVTEKPNYTQYGDPTGINLVRQKNGGMDILKIGTKVIASLYSHEGSAFIKLLGGGECF